MQRVTAGSNSLDGGTRSNRPALMLTALVPSVAAYQLNATMVSPAFPNIAEELSTTVERVGLSQTLFFLVGGLTGVVLSRYSDYIGRRRVLLLAMVAMVLGTLTAMFAPNVGVLIAGRLVQGASGATFQITYLLLRDTMSPKRFGAALGLITAINGGIGGVDGLAGGALADTVGFRAVFGVIALVSLVAIILAVRYVPEALAETSGRMDWLGAVTLSGALTCAILGVNQGSSDNWSSPPTLGLLIGIGVFAVVFWQVEKRRHDPLIATRHLRSRRVWPIMSTTLLTLSGFFAALYFTIVLLSQDDAAGYGMSATASALMFLVPPAVVGLCAAPLVGWWAPRIGWRRVMWTGLASSTILLALAAADPTRTWLVFSAFTALGIFYYGLTLTTVNALGVILSPKESPGALPGFNGACFGIGASLGIALVAPMASSGTPGGYQSALWTAVGISAAALLVSLFVSAPADIDSERV